MGIFSKFSKGLRKTRENMTQQMDEVIDAYEAIDDSLFEELEEILIMGDVGMPTAEKIIADLKRRIENDKITDPKAVREMLKDIVSGIVWGGSWLKLRTKPSIILVIGVNGVGKTTTIGKLSARFKAQGKSVVLGAADTFRAAAIEQLEVWAQRADVDLIKHAEGSDPASVVYDTIAAGKARGADLIICDTAGRLHNKKNLMDELHKISKVIDRELPEASKEILLVLDATTGQNAVNQAKEFKEAAGITGIILTKLDGTARGGVILAINNELDVPVKFVGVGEQID
ncbi:MAG: signal recognition particle-docking protein FtsY, partial [Clostridiales bacterium]|nr:signal recognition particle-docking protein FtsY [Clostridiales bacterium]